MLWTIQPNWFQGLCPGDSSAQFTILFATRLLLRWLFTTYGHFYDCPDLNRHTKGQATATHCEATVSSDFWAEDHKYLDRIQRHRDRYSTITKL